MPRRGRFSRGIPLSGRGGRGERRAQWRAEPCPGSRVVAARRLPNGCQPPSGGGRGAPLTRRWSKPSHTNREGRRPIRADSVRAGGAGCVGDLRPSTSRTTRQRGGLHAREEDVSSHNWYHMSSDCRSATASYRRLPLSAAAAGGGDTRSGEDRVLPPGFRLAGARLPCDHPLCPATAGGGSGRDGPVALGQGVRRPRPIRFLPSQRSPLPGTRHSPRAPSPQSPVPSPPENRLSGRGRRRGGWWRRGGRPRRRSRPPPARRRRRRRGRPPRRSRCATRG